MKPKVLLIGFLLLLFVPLVFFLTGQPFPLIGKKKKAALQITTTPSAQVFLDEIHQGTTPFKKEDLKPQEYKIRLEPEGELVPWEGRVSLIGGMMTVVERELASSEEISSGAVLTLEKITDKNKTSLTVITEPDNSVVNLDGEPRGFSPLTLNNLEAGSHILLISSSGFKEKTQEIRLNIGFRLNASVKLAKSQEKEEKEEEEKEATEAGKKKEREAEKEATVSASLEEEEMERPYVKIKETGTGWLRVRSEPVYKADNSNEVAKVKVGGVYKFLNETENGWYKIEYEEGESGWISGKYAEKYQ